MIKKPHVFVCLTFEEGCRREVYEVYEVRHDLIVSEVHCALKHLSMTGCLICQRSQENVREFSHLKAKIVKKVSGNSGPF